MNWGFDVGNLDKSVNPADDFYQFAVGGWIKENKIPHDESRWGSFHILRKQSEEALREILESVKNSRAGDGSDTQKVRDFYLSGMNKTRLNKDGVKPLYKFFDITDALQTAEDIAILSAKFRRMGISALWGADSYQDMKDRRVIALYLRQGGLGLPDRDYYLKNDKRSKKLREEYRKYIGNMHRMVDRNNIPEKTAVEAIMRIETRLAKSSMTRVELRDNEKQYNKMSASELSRLARSINWKKYFSELGIDMPDKLIINQPKFIKEADKMLREIPIADWKIYFKWKVTDAYAYYLGDKMVNEWFRFHGTILSGTKEIKPRWRRVSGEIDSSVGDLLGKFYVEKYFGGDSKKHINELVDNLMSSYRERLKSLDWMGDKTKKKALEKLNAFIRKLGYPDKWKSYNGLELSRESYLDNHVNSYKFEFDREMRKIGKKPDKTEWGMSPPTVNAYYNPLWTEIVFPAGIMQPPFFHVDADDAVNYGAIGAVIGHELTHGFDDEGSTFDKNGELKNWWQKEDRKLFMKKAGKLAEQFNKFEVLPGVFINGKLTLGENIADLGGLVIAYYAFKKSQKGKEKKIIDGFTPEQRFFLGAAQAEMGIARDEYLRLQVNTDPHSPSKARINLPLSNMTEFYEAFGVKRGDKMWRPEKDRVVIW